MPCSAEIEPLQLRHHAEHHRIDLVPALEELLLVGADRLGDVVMDVAVAEMAERQRTAGNERNDGGIGLPMNSGTAATGTEMSCLTEPPR